jgi:hypothetical protein
MTSKSKFFAAAVMLASVVAVAQSKPAAPAAPAATTTAAPAAATADAGTPMASADAGTAMAATSAMKLPSPESVKEVWDYYYYGKGDVPVLADLRLCLEIGKSGPNKSDCVREMTVTDNFRGSQRLLLWQAYLVPSDVETEVEVVAKVGEEARPAQKVKVKGSAVRQRTWTTVNLDKPGSWTVTFLHKGTPLKTMSFEVKAK